MVNAFKMGVLGNSGTRPTGETQSMKCNSRHSHTPRDGRKYMAGGVHHNGHGQRQDQQIHPLVSTCHIPNGKFHRVDAGNHRTKQQKKAGGKKALST